MQNGCVSLPLAINLLTIWHDKEIFSVVQSLLSAPSQAVTTPYRNNVERWTAVRDEATASGLSEALGPVCLITFIMSICLKIGVKHQAPSATSAHTLSPNKGKVEESSDCVVRFPDGDNSLHAECLQASHSYHPL
jgi:hypothetical protein